MALLCVSAAGYALGPQVSVVLRPQVQAVKPVVYFGDVAEVTSSDLPTLRRLVAVPLGAAPAPGRVLNVSSNSVRSWVRGQAGPVVAAAQWSGASQIEISRAQPAVSRGAFAAMAVRSGEVQIETRVEVLQDGAPGQYVRVRLPNTSTSVLALVVAPGRVEGTVQ